jgi:hypothetical protein
VDVKDIDVSKAIVTLAGPDSIYVRNIYYSGVRMSVVLKYDGADGAIVYGPYLDGDKLLLDSYEMGEAKLRIQGDDTLLVSDLILGGTGFAGRLKYDGVYSLKLDSYWETMPPKTKEMRIAELQNSVASSQATVADLRQKLAAAEQVAARAAAAPAAVVMPTRVVRSGFGGGASLLGTWNVTASRAGQNDEALFFAKYSIPLSQTANRTLYSIAGNATGTGRIGYGLHFFASGERTGRGYGFGSSYLIWLTRDRGYYGTNDTYVQIYQSFDDVRMIQLASTAVPTSIATSIKTDVLYDRNAKTITVMVNGNQVLSMPVFSPISRGDKVVLRTSGAPIQFTDLSVKVE